MTSDDADARLAEAARLTATVRRNSRWTVWTYITTGTLGFAVAPLFAHPGRPVYWLGIGVWMALIAAAQAIFRRRPVEHRSYQARYNLFMRIWFVTWLILCVIGSMYFRGDLAYWLPAGGVTALIMYTGAALEFRATRQ